MERLSDAPIEIRHLPAERPVFCIVDPSLKDFVGHHFAYDEAVAHAAEAAGFRTVVLAHRDVTETIAGTVEVRRCFRRDIWGSTLGGRLWGPVGTAANLLLANNDFGADLTAGLDGLTFPPGSILFAHTIIRNQLLALARFVRKQPARGSIDVILLLRYQPDFYNDPLCARAFRRLERAAATGRRVRLATDSARLSREHGHLTSLPIEVMPIPLTTAPAVERNAPDASLRFVSLGNARDEKGYVEILDAIRMLRDSRELDGLEFVLQSNDAAPDVQRAINLFETDRPENVTLLHQSLSPAEYNAELAAADVVLVPYWRNIYRARTSGVFLEGVAAGKIVIATRDTWMSDELEQHGAGVLVEDHDPASIVAAIRAVRRDHDRLAPAARAGQTACRTRHNPATLVRQAAEGQAPAREIRRVAVLYPWTDFLEGQSGASLRTGLLVDKLSPLVEAVRVVQTGPRAPIPVDGKWRKMAEVAHALVVGRPEPDRRDTVARAGNVEVETIPRRLRQDLARIAYRVPFRLLMRRRFGQELMAWYFLEARLDPKFRARVEELVEWADVVLLEYPFWAGFVAPLCRARGKRLIVTSHDVLSRQFAAGSKARNLIAWLECRGLASGDRAVCVSESDREFFAANGIAAQVIANPVDLSRMTVSTAADPRQTLRDRYNIALPPGPVCLFVGSRFAPNIDAAMRIQEMAGDLETAAFAIVGDCAEAARGSNWIALGRIEEGALVLLYDLAALVLIPLREGTGSSVKTIEAMAAGKPVLGTSVAFRGLAARPGEDCVVLDDLARWPAQIAELLTVPDRLAAIGHAARLAAKAYDYRVVFEAYLPLMGITRTEG